MANYPAFMLVKELKQATEKEIKNLCLTLKILIILKKMITEYKIIKL